MKTFEEAKKEFLEGFSYKDTLISQLKSLDAMSAKWGDMRAYGCEFVLNGIDTHSEYWNDGDFMRDEYDNVGNHGFELKRNWDTFLFYSPSDYRGLVFDFGYLGDKGTILAYDGLSKPFSHSVVREFSIDEFLREYGLKQLLSVTHYRVEWSNIGYSWNN